MKKREIIKEMLQCIQANYLKLLIGQIFLVTLFSYNQTILLNPYNIIAYNGKGETLAFGGQYQEAIDCFDQAIAIFPDGIFFYNKGNALERLGKKNQALENYQNASKLNPTDKQFIDAIKNINCSDKLQEEDEIIITVNSSEKLQEKEEIMISDNKQIKSEKILDLQKENYLIQNSIFMKEINEIQQNEVLINMIVKNEQIKQQFIEKLMENDAFLWVDKFLSVHNCNNQQICHYYQQILPLLFTQNEAQKIKILENTIKSTQFSDIHYGVFDQKLVAIKELKFKENEDDEFIIALLREIAILAVCQSQYIGKVIGVYFNPNLMQVQTISPRYYMDLDEVLFQGKPIFIPNKKEIILQLLEALQYIHQAGFIHLDIKPKNIMFKSSKLNKIVLLDFGVSKIYKGDQDTSIIAISYFYCSPEVMENKKSKVSYKSDIFSFALVLYEVITERRVWQNYLGKGIIAIYNLIRENNFDFFHENTSTGNQDLDKLIIKCVQNDPEKRPSASEILQEIKMII